MGMFLLSMAIIAVSIFVLLKGSLLRLDAKTSKWGGLTGILVGLFFFISSVVIVIGAGEIGVVVIFGQVQKKPLRSGINLVMPYADVVRYSTRIIEQTQEEGNLIEARVNNGLTVRIDCTTLYYINPDMADIIYDEIATSLSILQEKILMPNLRTVIRNVVSKYSSEEVYSSKREQVSVEIEESLRNYVSNKGILIDRFLIRNIKLPEDVDRAIQQKISAQQEAEAMTYKKQKAEQAAEIKIIEAEGLAKAQRIINSTLTPTYLQHEAIEAYKELANSPNTTFIILPTSPTASGMPIILNASK